MQQKNNTVMLGIIAVVIIGAVVAGTILLKPKSSTQSSDQNSVTQTTSNISETATYKDGSYDTTTNFITPGGNESITVNITLSNGMVASSSVSQQGDSRESEEYGGDFISSYKSFVEGKGIGTLSLSRVAGSSLTTRAFNQALHDIRSQAQN